LEEEERVPRLPTGDWNHLKYHNDIRPGKEDLRKFLGYESIQRVEELIDADASDRLVRYCAGLKIKYNLRRIPQIARDIEDCVTSCDLWKVNNESNLTRDYEAVLLNFCHELPIEHFRRAKDGISYTSIEKVWLAFRFATICKEARSRYAFENISPLHWGESKTPEHHNEFEIHTELSSSGRAIRTNNRHTGLSMVQERPLVLERRPTGRVEKNRGQSQNKGSPTVANVPRKRASDLDSPLVDRSRSRVEAHNEVVVVADEPAAVLQPISIIWLNSPADGESFLEIQCESAAPLTVFKQRIAKEFDLRRHGKEISRMSFLSPFEGNATEPVWNAFLKSRRERSITITFSTI